MDLDQALQMLRHICNTYTFTGPLAEAQQMAVQAATALQVVTDAARGEPVDDLVGSLRADGTADLMDAALNGEKPSTPAETG